MTLDISSLQLDDLRFPGRAGELQGAADWPNLIAELGGHYDEYHEFVAQQAEKLRERPEPADFPGRRVDFQRAARLAQELARAEMLLRVCRLEVLGAEDPMREALKRPVLDERHRIVGMTDASDARRSARAGSGRVARWTPPTAPPPLPR